MRDLMSAGNMVKVMVFEDISSIPTDDELEVMIAGPYASLRAVVCHSGTPIAMKSLPLDGRLASREVREVLITAFTESTMCPPLPVIDPSSLPKISVVVPTTFGRFEQLKSCVTALSLQRYSRFEVLVVDNRPARPNAVSERGELACLENVRVLQEALQGISAARQRGVEEATGDIVAFTDDDARPILSWLLAIGTRFRIESDLTCVSGLVIPDNIETEVEALFEDAGVGPLPTLDRYTYALLGTSDRWRSVGERYRVQKTSAWTDESEVHWLYQVGKYGMGNNFAVRRDYLGDKPRFPLWLGAGTEAEGGEDAVAFIEILWNGGRIGYEPSAIVRHRNRATYVELHQQMYAYGAGFVAALAELALRDPRHLLGYGLMTIPALRALRGTQGTRRGERPQGFPTELRKAERRGLVMGPAALARSRYCTGSRIRQLARQERAALASQERFVE